MGNAAADRWHQAAGNWFKIFKGIDAENSRTIAFDELVKYVRAPYPGLRIAKTEVSDRDLQGFWKAIDTEGMMDVSLHKFMVFMRKHGGHLSVIKSPPSKE